MVNLGNTDVRASLRFTSAVDSAITSSNGGDSEASRSPVRGFASIVDNAMKSSVGGEDSEASRSPVRGFASRVDNAIRSIGGDSGTSHSPVHGFSSGADNVMPSATEDVEGFQIFTLAELVAATNNFSRDKKIGVGKFGGVYRGKLVDGREVAINRGEPWSRVEQFREIVVGYLLTFLPREHDKHVVGLVGFCADKNERMLVYEYMKNGALYDRLHDNKKVLKSWKMRIKIALDASRGIKYLHNYVVHGDIKSSNILLDATWRARVCDFGLSFMSPEPDTPKSDVYGLGVVLLELLTGKSAIFNSGEDRGTATSVLHFAVPAILSGDLVKILDPRVRTPGVNEAVALELVASTAIHCVSLEEKDRPTTDAIVVNLERALAICHSTHYTISSATIPLVLHTKRKMKNLCCFKMI